MPPTVPSPTPINGVRAPPGQRLPLAQLQQNDFAFALYAQALLAWQRDGNKAKDPDAGVGTSYFQVTGVHGVPYIPWQNDPTEAVVDTVGYCTHKSVLFVPWHRPYLLLYEQIIYQYALDIVNSSTGYAKQAYNDVLEYVRLPFWDFNKDPSLPAAVKEPTLNITVPGSSDGEQKTITLDQNPFYSYKFTSDYAWDIVVQELEWNGRHPDNWVRESKRCPNENGVSQPQVAEAQMKKVGKDYKSRAYSLLTSVHDFAEFTCMAYSPGTNYDSVEVWHNYVHNYTGSNDRGNFDYYPLGNLTDVQASSFDPIFWLLHCHVDRMAAIWQAMNYNNIVIDTLPSGLPRYTANTGTKEGGDSHLEPWHKSADHNMNDYWIANDTKTLESTFAGGYYYPETPLNLRDNQAAMQQYATQQVNVLYAPSSVTNMMAGFASSDDAAVPAEQAPAAEKAPAKEAVVNGNENQAPLNGGPDPDRESSSTNITSSNGPKPITSVEWRAFVRVKGFALQGTWGIHLFFGEPPADSSEWFMSDNRVGTVNILSNENLDACANCSVQSASGLLVTGMVLLTNELRHREMDITDRDAVVEYLKEKLTWRVVKDAQNVPVTPEMALLVGVGARDVAYPVSANDLPVWGPTQVYPAASAGKDGGLERDVEEA